jgi:hypothetical protein
MPRIIRRTIETITITTWTVTVGENESPAPKAVPALPAPLPPVKAEPQAEPVIADPAEKD